MGRDKEAALGAFVLFARFHTCSCFPTGFKVFQTGIHGVSVSYGQAFA